MLVERPVNFAVLFVARIVIEPLFDQGDGQHDDQWQYERYEETDAQGWDNLRQRDHEEEKVAELVELIEEADGQERKPIVLAVVNRV